MIETSVTIGTAGIGRKMLVEDWINSLQTYRKVGSDDAWTREVSF